MQMDKLRDRRGKIARVVTDDSCDKRSPISLESHGGLVIESVRTSRSRIVDKAHFFLRDSEAPDKSFDEIGVEISSRKYSRRLCAGSVAEKLAYKYQ